jgi:hypothetical protein
VTVTASEIAAASHAKTATAKEEAHLASGATDRAAHDENVVADATTPATDQDRPSVAMTARKTAHVSHEDEAAAIATKKEARAMHHEVPVAAHQHPAALVDPTSHLAKHVADQSGRHRLSRRKSRPMSR